MILDTLNHNPLTPPFPGGGLLLPLSGGSLPPPLTRGGREGFGLFFPAFFFGYPRYTLAARQFVLHIRRAHAMLRQQHHAMEPQVGSLIHQMGSIPLLARQDELRRLLADLLKDGVFTPAEKFGDIGTFRRCL